MPRLPLRTFALSGALPITRAKSTLTMNCTGGELGSVRAVVLSTAADGFDPYERRLQIDVGVERGFTADTAYVSMVVDELRSRSFLITRDSARRLSQALGRVATAAGA